MAAKKPTAKAKVRRKPDAARREVIAKVLLTEDEHAAFQAAAESAGMSLSTWMRATALAATRGGHRWADDMPASGLSLPAGQDRFALGAGPARDAGEVDRGD